MFSQIKNETLNQCELWKPVSYVNLNRQTHNIVNDFLAQVSAAPFDGLQWVHDHFAHRYLKNYIWWRRRENEKQLFNNDDFAESWVAMNNFICAHEAG